MSFNKRIFDIDLLVRYYREDPEIAICKAIGKTDCFIFYDEESREIVDLWIEGKIEEANEKLKKYVLRISAKTS